MNCTYKLHLTDGTKHTEKYLSYIDAYTQAVLLAREGDCEVDEIERILPASFWVYEE